MATSPRRRSRRRSASKAPAGLIKGAIGIALKIGGLDVCFVAAHLCARGSCLKLSQEPRSTMLYPGGLAKVLAPAGRGRQRAAATGCARPLMPLFGPAI